MLLGCCGNLPIPKALGIMLFIMIAGYSPFDAPEAGETPRGG